MYFSSLRLLFLTTALCSGGLSSLAVAQDTDKDAPAKEERPLTDEEIRLLYPLLEKHIKQLKAESRKQARAQNTPLTSPKLLRDVHELQLDPGSPIPVIKVSDRFVTTLTFHDVTGQPWPITSVTTALEESFSFQKGSPEQNNDHTLSITPSALYSSGNIIIYFEGLSTPVPFMLEFSDDEVVIERQYTMIGQGPRAASVPTGVSLNVRRTGSELSGFLDLVPPPGAKPLVVQEGYNRIVNAWLLNGEMYVRTPLTIMSPGFSEFAQGSGPTGSEMKIFKLTSPANVLLVSNRGQAEFVTVETR